MRLEEETLSSKIVFRGRLVTLRVDTVRLPNGGESHREVVVHRGAVAAVPLMDDNTLLLVRQHRQAAGEVLLEIPAGTLEPGEDPTACAQRELQEEIGFKAHTLTPMFNTFLAPGYSSEMLHIFLARNLEKSPRSGDEDEFIEVVRVPLEDVVNKIISGEIKDAKTVCAVLMTERIIKNQK